MMQFYGELTLTYGYRINWGKLPITDCSAVAELPKQVGPSQLAGGEPDFLRLRQAAEASPMKMGDACGRRPLLSPTVAG